MKNQVIRRFMHKKLGRLLKTKLLQQKKKLALKKPTAISPPEPALAVNLPLSSSWSQIASRLKMASQESVK